MTEPQVQVFGPLQVSLDGHTARIGAGRQRAVLGRLVLAGGKAIGIDRLAEDVWEGAPPPQAPAVLQVQIHNLRRVLEPERRPRTAARILVSEGAGYALRLDEGSVDAWRFEAQLREYEQRVHNPDNRPGPMERYRMLDEALNCWHGAAFESFSGASWAVAEVSRLTDLRITATELRAQAALELGRLGEVVTVLRRQVEEHPGREESARLLASAQYRLGQQVEALDTVRRTREYLRAEFGIDPGPRLSDLESAILNQSVDPEQLAEGSESPIIVAEHATAQRKSASEDEHSTLRLRPALSGADATFYPRQRAAIQATAAEARHAGLRLIWLVGEAGVGKTTLTSAVAAGLRADGWTTASGRCAEVDGAPPAWAWSEILSELGGAPIPFDARPGAVEPFTIVRAVTELCRNLVENGPVAIVLEDVHRADAATLQVLRQLANWLQREPVLIIVTAREPESVPALRATEAALADRMTEPVELTGLDLAGTRRIAQEAGLASIDSEELRLLHQRTGGNPLFVRELSKLMVNRGDSRSLPGSVRAVLIDRIEQLPTGVLAVLQHIAVWGTAIDLDTLVELSSVAEEDLVDLIDAATAAGLTRFDQCDRIILDHALVQDAVYNSIPPLRRGRMHWKTLELLEHWAEDRQTDLCDAETLAHHAVGGATRTTAARALGYVLRAARRGDRRPGTTSLWHMAVGLHELAGHAGEGADRSDRLLLFDSLCALAGALAQDGRHPAARVVRERALALATDLDDRQLVVRALTCWRAPAIWGVRDWCARDNRLRDALDSALLQAESESVRARLLAARVLESESIGEVASMYQRACEALDAAHTDGDPELVCTALNAVAYTLTGPATLDGWRPVALELLRVSRLARRLDYQALAHYLCFRAACRDADLAAASRYAARALECAADGRLRSLSDALVSFRAVVAVLRGDLATAEREYRQFDARMTGSGIANADAMVLIGALTMAWARGDISGLLDRLTPLYNAEPELIAQLYVLALLHAGNKERAAALFREHHVVRRDFYWQLMTAFRAHAAIALGAVEVARELFDALLPYSGTLIGFESGAAVFGPMDNLLADLAELLGAAEQARTLRARAQALLQRINKALKSLAPQPDTAPLARIAASGTPTAAGAIP